MRLLVLLLACHCPRSLSAQTHYSTTRVEEEHFSIRHPTKNNDDKHISPSSSSAFLKINWSSDTIAISKTTATLQVVSNPMLNSQTSPVAPKLFQALSDLQADLVRYVPWFPYPHVGVAELEPPNITTQTSYWNFTGIQQQLYDIYKTVTTTTTTSTTNNDKPRRVVINFSTQPTWLFNTTRWDYTDDINEADWSYPRGNAQPSTTKPLAEYYGRLASWMIHGEFQDEFQTTIRGGPSYGDLVTHWEIFNEPEMEHRLTIGQYNVLYDAVVQEIRRQADPQHRIAFVGMGLCGHDRWDWWEGFLTPDNHHPSVRDAVANGMASFHFYGVAPTRTNVSSFGQTFDQIPGFLRNVDRIVKLRNRLSPTTGLACNEAGVIPPDDNNMDAPPSPPIYYNMVAGFFTIMWSELSARGIDVVGSSQFCGCPAIPEWDIPNPQYPGVSMTNWTSGSGNPRYWALKLVMETFGPGDQIVESTTTTTTTTTTTKDDVDDAVVYSQARITAKTKQRALILVNKSHEPQTVVLVSSNDEWRGALVHTVDGTTHDEPWKSYTLNHCCSTKVVLEPFAVSVVLGADENKTGKAIIQTD
jgi:hypothetical protein